MSILDLQNIENLRNIPKLKTSRIQSRIWCTEKYICVISYYKQIFDVNLKWGIEQNPDNKKYYLFKINEYTNNKSYNIIPEKFYDCIESNFIFNGNKIVGVIENEEN